MYDSEPTTYDSPEIQYIIKYTCSLCPSIHTHVVIAHSMSEAALIADNDPYMKRVVEIRVMYWKENK